MAVAHVAAYGARQSAADARALLDETATYWDYVEAETVLAERQPCVRVYLTQNDVGEAQLRDLRAMVESLKGIEGGLDLGSLDVVVEIVKDEDWANNWKQFYRPMEIGQRLLVKPSWEELPAPTDRIVLEIDPGMVFGTGTHETTQLCLAQLDEHVRPGMKVIDLGCGSGILSVAALLLGADRALGVDIDPNAVDIAYNNADENGIARDRYTVVAGNVLDDNGFVDSLGTGYDIVVANIVAGVIVPLTDIVPRLLKKGGLYITSGIIAERAQEVIDAMQRNGFTVTYTENARTGWSSSQRGNARHAPQQTRGPGGSISPARAVFCISENRLSPVLFLRKLRLERIVERIGDFQNFPLHAQIAAVGGNDPPYDPAVVKLNGELADKAPLFSPFDDRIRVDHAEQQLCRAVRQRNHGVPIAMVDGLGVRHILELRRAGIVGFQIAG